MENELYLRKLVRTTLLNEGKKLVESLSDESVDSLEKEMVKPWLIYYKMFATEGYNAMGIVHKATFNTKLSVQEKFEVINQAFIDYMKKLQTLPSPYLNENIENFPLE